MAVPIAGAFSALDVELVERLRASVLQVLDPSMIVLFGSQARGTAGPDSDVDLLVIDDEPFSPTRSRRRIIGDIRRAIPAGPWPVDVLVFDTNELDRWRHTTNHVLSRALDEGVVVYERPRSR
jgi:predicted nucleotidyltransferase